MILQSSTTRTDEKYSYVTLALLLCGALGIIFFICMQMYKKSSQEYMDEQDILLASVMRDTQAEILNWRDNLFYKTSVISTSTLYHLFAQEVQKNALDHTLNGDANRGAIIETDMALQAPLLRAMLRDFLQYSGFGEGRLMSAEGQELLSVIPDMPPLNQIQHDTVRRAIESGDMAFGSAHYVSNMLVQDFAVPLLPILRGSEPEPVVAALFFNVQIEDAINRFTDDEKNIPIKSSLYILQTNELPYTLLKSNDMHPLPNDMQNVWKGFIGEIASLDRRKSMEGKEDVFSRGMRIYNPNWWIIAEMPEDVSVEALDAIALRIALQGSAAGLTFSLLLALIWWSTMGKSQRQTTLRFKELFYAMRQQNVLLNSIYTALKDGLFMADIKGSIVVCNQSFAKVVHATTPEELVNKKLYMLFKGEGGDRLLAGLACVLRKKKRLVFEIPVNENDKTLLYRVNLSPCGDLELNNLQGVVGILSDITEFRQNALANKKMQQNVVNVLVRAIESVDPYLAGHSAMMQALGVLMVNHLALSKEDAQTIDIAAKLSQLGKLGLPKELWSKKGSFTEEERQQLRLMPVFAYDILRDGYFDLPIAEAVYAMNEKMDGSGWPLHLKGEAINIHARILAILHAFCAMLKDRSWRKGMEVSEALDTLRQNPAFDQEIVTALEALLTTEEAARILHPEKERGQVIISE